MRRHTLSLLKGAAGLLLLFNSLTDLKSRSICVIPTAAAACAGILAQLAAAGGISPEMLCSLLPGAMLWIGSLLFPGSIGEGDCLTVLALGALTDFTLTTEILMTALMMAGAVSVVLLILKKAEKKTAVPFVPFLMAAWIVMIFIGGR